MCVLILVHTIAHHALAGVRVSALINALGLAHLPALINAFILAGTNALVIALEVVLTRVVEHAVILVKTNALPDVLAVQHHVKETAKLFVVLSARNHVLLQAIIAIIDQIIQGIIQRKA